MPNNLLPHKTMRYTEEIFNMLSKGGFISANSVSGAVKGYYDALEENFSDYYDYYKTARGYHARSINSGLGWNVTSSLAFVNAPILTYCGEIRSAVLLVHGEKAHSRYFSEDTFKKLKGDNKQLLIVPGASHTDLYDRMDVIPFDTIVEFYQKYLK